LGVHKFLINYVVKSRAKLHFYGNVISFAAAKQFLFTELLPVWLVQPV